MASWVILENKKLHALLNTSVGPTETISQVILAPRTLQILKLGLTFFQNSLPRGREVGPPFSLAPSFAISVDVEFLAAPWGSWGVTLPLSDLRSAEVAGDFSAPCKSLKKLKWSQDFKSKRSLFYKYGLGLCMLSVFFIIFCIFQIFYMNVDLC